jgi:hypothetical protein
LREGEALAEGRSGNVLGEQPELLGIGLDESGRLGMIKGPEGLDLGAEASPLNLSALRLGLAAEALEGVAAAQLIADLNDPALSAAAKRYRRAERARRQLEIEELSDLLGELWRERRAGIEVLGKERIEGRHERWPASRIGGSRCEEPGIMSLRSGDLQGGFS